jgi:hypothetical protein
VAKLYQVFVGCPFAREVRKPFDRLKKELEAETPLSVVLADTVGVSSSDYLLEHITELIRDSAACLFDATGGNPNVSLEVGIAHTIPVDFILTFKTRKKRKKAAPAPTPRDVEVRSIISDLQGKNRIEYKTFDSLKEQLETRYLGNLPYVKRWHQFKRDNKDMVPHALKLFADLRSSGRSTGARLAAYLEGTGFSTGDVTNALRSAKLIVVQRGRTGGYFYPSK